MNYRKLVFIAIAGGLLAHCLLAESVEEHTQIADQKRQKYLSIAKKVGAGLGIAAVAISGGLGGYFYLRHRKKQRFLNFQEALNAGNIEKFKTLAPDIVTSGFSGSNLLHLVLGQAAFLREKKMQEAVKFVVQDLSLNLDLNKANTDGKTPLFKVMDEIVYFEQSTHYVDQLLNVFDFFIELGANPNSTRNDHKHTVAHGMPTCHGSLLHTAATIYDNQVRKKVIAHLVEKGVDPEIKDFYNNNYEKFLWSPMKPEMDGCRECLGLG